MKKATFAEYSVTVTGKMRTKLHFITACFILLLSCQAQIHSQTAHLRLGTVVIDPGHGGRDPGCVRGGVMEKDIVLSVAQKLGRMIQDSLPGVRVIYTRTADRFVELQERADIANRNGCDLFISIHVNSTKSTKPHGSETFCMGLDMSDDNMEVCQMENSVITLEDDYSSRYEGFDPRSPESYIIFSLLQNAHLEQSLKFAEDIQTMYGHAPIGHNRGVRQAGFVVLWRCTSPAVLTELGFLSNDDDYSVLADRKYHTALAGSLFRAVRQYRDRYEFSRRKDGSGGPVPSRAEPEPGPGPAGQTSTLTAADTAGRMGTAVEFAIQILSSDKLIPQGHHELKGVECHTMKIGDRYKYLVGHYSSQAEALKALPGVRNKFPDAFIIKVRNSPEHEHR